MTHAGAEAERRAASFLERQGLELVARNWRCRFGELDLVLREGETLVFVEVRRRARRDFGGAAESITAAKRQRLLRAARHYLARAGGARPCRFDVVLIDGSGERLEWIRNAFGE